nr:hypothetical protein OG999_49520 [Streptomyces sp. NBC_00886]
MTEHSGGVPLKVGTTGFVVLAYDEGAMVAAQLVYRPDNYLAVRPVLLGPGSMEVTSRPGRPACSVSAVCPHTRVGERYGSGFSSEVLPRIVRLMPMSGAAVRD